MPGNAKDNHWKILPSKSPAAAATPASSRTRPKQSIPEGEPLCNSSSGGEAGGGPNNHQQNQSGTGRGNLFPARRRSVLPLDRPHDQQRQPLFDFPPAISPASAVPGGPGGRRLHPRGEGTSGLGSGSSNGGGRSGVSISRVFGNGCSAPIGETTPLPDRGLPGPRGENISSSIGSRNPGSTITHQWRPGGDAVFSCDHDDSGLRVNPAGIRASDAQAIIPILERVNPIAPLVTLGGGNPQSGSSDLSAPRGFSRVPTSKNAVRLLKSLLCNPPSRSGGLDLNGSYRSGWTREDPPTTVVPPPPPPGVAPSPPAAVSTPDRASPRVPSLSQKTASPILGPFAVPPHSWAKVVARSALPVGSPPRLHRNTHYRVPPRTREEAEGWDGTLLTSHGTPGGLPVLPLERRSESDQTPTKNLQWIVKQDLLEFNLLSGQTEY